MLTHIALDLPTSFGTMIFTPFPRERYAPNLLSILDPVCAASILLALGLACWRRPWAWKAAVFGMSGLGLYPGVAAAVPGAARGHFTRVVEAHGAIVLRAEAYPRFPGLWTWLGLAETPTAVIRGGVDLVSSAPMRLDYYLTPEPDGLFTTAGELEAVQAFLEFARFPWMAARKVAGHTALEYYGLRVGAAPHHHDFRLEVLIDGAGKVRQMRLNHRL